MQRLGSKCHRGTWRKRAFFGLEHSQHYRSRYQYIQRRRLGDRRWRQNVVHFDGLPVADGVVERVGVGAIEDAKIGEVERGGCNGIIDAVVIEARIGGGVGAEAEDRPIDGRQRASVMIRGIEGELERFAGRKVEAGINALDEDIA